jgi:hypothetical protein
VLGQPPCRRGDAGVERRDRARANERLAAISAGGAAAQARPHDDDGRATGSGAERPADAGRTPSRGRPTTLGRDPEEVRPRRASLVLALAAWPSRSSSRGGRHS